MPIITRAILDLRFAKNACATDVDVDEMPPNGSNYREFTLCMPNSSRKKLPIALKMAPNECYSVVDSIQYLFTHFASAFFPPQNSTMLAL